MTTGGTRITRQATGTGERVVVSWSSGSTDLQVVIYAANLDKLLRTIEDPAILRTEREDLVCALLTTNRENITEVRRCVDAKATDGPKGEPAWQWFEKGELVQAQHFDDGILQKTITLEELRKKSVDEKRKRENEIFSERIKILQRHRGRGTKIKKQVD